jgi:hydroxymethylpyrimidine/phosphomethylpyrimidine kinase
LLPCAFLVTPNLPEAEVLTGLSIRAREDMRAAAQRLYAFGCPNVLIKGGHLPGEPVDLLYGKEGARFFEGTRVETRHTHGTGCAYSAAITAGLALRRSLEEAVTQAKTFVQRAIETAPGLGAGNGPLNFNTSVR